MTGVRELSERYWNGDVDLISEHHPVRPSLGRAAEEIADGVLVLKSVASVNVVDTGDGLVLLDTGGPYDADHLFESVRRWRPSAPDGRVHAAVFSHHHIDHVFGLGPFEQEAAAQRWPAPVVYAHQAVAANFRRYERTLGWNTAINLRQFGRRISGFSFPDRYRYPDVSYEGSMTFEQGGVCFELFHGLGETDDATWTWMPDRKLLHPGDLFIWALPNAGNPQKVQRYAGEWAAALREMAALGAEVLLCGHGMPIFGADRIRTALNDTAELLESLEDQTLALMNAGAALDEVLHTVEVPQHLRDKPYLQPVYDHPQFVVRNIWRRFGGWHDGEPDTVLPAPRAQQAREWIALAGGVDNVLARVSELADSGTFDDLRLASHLVEFAVLAEPGSGTAHSLRARVYRGRSTMYDSLMARHLMSHAALSSDEGRRDLYGRDANEGRR